MPPPFLRLGAALRCLGHVLNGYRTTIGSLELGQLQIRAWVYIYARPGQPANYVFFREWIMFTRRISALKLTGAVGTPIQPDPDQTTS